MDDFEKHGIEDYKETMEQESLTVRCKQKRDKLDYRV